MQQQEKASGFAIQLPSNLLSSKAASLRGRPVLAAAEAPLQWVAQQLPHSARGAIPPLAEAISFGILMPTPDLPPRSAPPAAARAYS